MTDIPIDCSTCGRNPCVKYYRMVCYENAVERNQPARYRNWYPDDKHLVPWVLMMRGLQPD